MDDTQLPDPVAAAARWLDALLEVDRERTLSLVVGDESEWDFAGICRGLAEFGISDVVRPAPPGYPDTVVLVYFVKPNEPWTGESVLIEEMQLVDAYIATMLLCDDGEWRVYAFGDFPPPHPEYLP